MKWGVQVHADIFKNIEQSQTVPDNCPLAFTSSYLNWYQGRYQREAPGTKDSWALWENSDGRNSTSRDSFNLFCVPQSTEITPILGNAQK